MKGFFLKPHHSRWDAFVLICAGTYFGADTTLWGFLITLLIIAAGAAVVELVRLTP